MTRLVEILGYPIQVYAVTQFTGLVRSSAKVRLLGLAVDMLVTAQACTARQLDLDDTLAPTRLWGPPRRTLNRLLRRSCPGYIHRQKRWLRRRLDRRAI
jgi:hypothetical protein